MTFRNAYLRPCMGGWCNKRDVCEHYQRPQNKVAPAERLCGVGVEAQMFFRRASNFDGRNKVRGPNGAFVRSVA